MSEQPGRAGKRKKPGFQKERTKQAGALAMEEQGCKNESEAAVNVV